MCYYCTKTAQHDWEIFDHEVKHHKDESKKFSMRIRSVDEASGYVIYKSQHYDITLSHIEKRIHNGDKVVIDGENRKLRFKRFVQEEDIESYDHDNETDIKHIEPEHESEIGKRFYELLPHVIEMLRGNGRREDWISVLECVLNGKISVNNIALNLLLDLGQYLNQSSSGQMRYSKTSLDFWLVVKKIFRGKGIRFFTGSKNHMVKKLKCDQSEKLTFTPESVINFAVPSDRILRRESDKYKISAEEPGLIPEALSSFKEAKGDGSVQCKISIDGKKLAYGFGKKLGDENMGGHEDTPTLKERISRHENELASTQVLINNLLQMGDSNLETINHESKNELIVSLKEQIAFLSNRIKELRKLIRQKDTYVQNMIAKIVGPWQDSKLAPALSFMKTQVIKSKACIRKMIQCVDTFGKHIAVLNGVGEYYRQGIAIEVDLGRQGNYMCLRELSEHNTDAPLDPSIIKQRSQDWHDLRNNAVITGSSFHRALGISKLKDQKEHYDKIFRGVVSQPSAELQKAFDHGNANEVNALATFVSKIMPAYYPNLVFKEDGCAVKTMDTETKPYAVISGDGTCISSNRDNVIAIEFKCPMTNKQYTTDTYYKLPHYYASQVLSQMAVKQCDIFANICFTEDSTTYITGGHDSGLWNAIWELATELYGYGKTKRPTRGATCVTWINYNRN